MWFSLFVACAALVYSFLSFTVSNDPRLRGHLARMGSAVDAVLPGTRARPRESQSLHRLGSGPPEPATCTVPPAFLILTDNFHTTPAVAAGWAGALLVLLGLAKILAAPKTAVPPQSRPVFN